MRVRWFRAAWSRRFSWTAGAVLLIGGSIFGYLAWQSASRYERRHAAALFAEHLSDRRVVLDRALRDIASELTRAAALLAVNPSMSRAEFGLVVSDALVTHPFIHAFEWVPLVPAAARSSHEQTARRDGFADYTIVARERGGNLAPESRRPQHAPVFYVEPLEPNRRALGFDLLSESPTSAALAEAAGRRAMALTGVIDLVPDSGDPAGILAVAPVLLPPDKGQRPDTLLGFVAIVLRGQDLLRELSLRQQGDARARVRFQLVDETGPPAVIAQSPGWRPQADAPGAHSHGIEMGTRRWRLSGQPTPLFFAEHSTREPLVLGLAAVGLWESLGLMVLALTWIARREAHREQEEIARAALNATAEGVLVADAHGRSLLLNEAAEQILGTHRAGIALQTAGRRLADGRTPVLSDQLPLARVLRGEEANELEAFVDPPGTAEGRWLSINAAPVRNGDGTIRGGVVTFRDITARKRAEAEARASLRHLQQMKYALDEAAIVGVSDRDGTILYVNDRLCDISGFSREELVGAHFRIFNSGYHPREFFQELWATIAGGRTWRGTMCNRSKHGTTYWLDTTIVPLLEESDRPDRYLAICTDISDRVRQDASLRQLSNAIEQIADSIFITDPAGIIQYVNAGFETTTGYSREEAIGQTPAIFRSGRQDEQYYQTLWATITAGEVFRSKPINRKKNGEEFHAEQTITPIRDSAGRITHFVSVVKDVTQRIRSQERDIEMAYAARVQQRLYPAEPPVIDGFDVAGAVIPAAATGGDYFDFLPMSGGTLGVAVGDVCGHGLAAALIMAETRAYLRPLTSVCADPAAIFCDINRWLHDDLMDSGQYVTMFLLRLDPGAHRLEYANAGHVSGCVLDAAGAVRAVLESTGVPLGLFAESSYGASCELALHPGDIVVLLTDGITEAENAEGQQFGVEGAIRTVREHRREPAHIIARRVTEAVRAFIDGSKQCDDVTIVVCKVTRPH